MKTFFTLLFIAAFTATGFAYNGARLSITSLTEDDIKVTIDGRNYSTGRSGQNEDFVFENFAAGRHKVEVYSSRIRRSRDNRNNGMQLIWSGNVYLRDQYHSDIVINRFGKAFTDEMRIDENQGGYTTGSGNTGAAISDREFENLHRTVTSQSFDNNAVSMIQQAAKFNAFSTEQVRRLATALKFDDSRLLIAKALYARATDKRNYYRVNEAFSFQATKEDLSRWLLQQ